jgi:hypothetical protein
MTRRRPSPSSVAQPQVATHPTLEEGRQQSGPSGQLEIDTIEGRLVPTSPVEAADHKVRRAALPRILWLFRLPEVEELVPDADERRQRANAFERTFNPSAHVEHWFTDFAVRACEEATRAAEYLDTKAEKFIGFVGAVAAVFVSILTKEALTTGRVTLILSLPVIACVLAAVRMALQVHQPGRQYHLPSIEDALCQYASDAQLGSRAFGAKLHQAREYQKIIVDAKSALLEQAYKWVWLALLFLLLPIAGALVQPPRAPAPTPVVVQVSSPAPQPANIQGTPAPRRRR